MEMPESDLVSQAWQYSALYLQSLAEYFLKGSEQPATV
jgi:hypothetical protein